MKPSAAVAGPAWWSPRVHGPEGTAGPALRQPVAQEISRPCTTAREVREQALEPAMDIIALCDAACEPLARLRALAGDDAQAIAAVHALANIGRAIRGCAQTMTPLLDAAHARLALVEQQGGYGDMVPEVDSENASGRVLARLVSMYIDTLDRATAPSELKSARHALNALFAEHGDALFERRVKTRMAPGVLEEARKAFALWQMKTAYAAEMRRAEAA